MGLLFYFHKYIKISQNDHVPKKGPHNRYMAPYTLPHEHTRQPHDWSQPYEWP